MTDSITCFNCRQEFVPDVGHEFPNCHVYWHECKPGVFAQNVKTKERKYNRYVKLEYTAKENVNRLLMSFHNPVLRKKHDPDNEDNFNGGN